jgi:outer membrane protein OmpA-like peptidoglycan-associated protein
VYDIMVNSGKVDSHLITLAGYGPNKPAVAGTTDAAKSKNRRVEIFVKVPEK